MSKPRLRRLLTMAGFACVVGAMATFSAPAQTPLAQGD
jgi:hypothetical protein